MNKLYKVEELVEKVLREHTDSRDDNFILIYRVYREINEDLVLRELFFQVMLYHKEYKLPSFESVTRARRKLMKKFPELKPSKEVQEIRDKEEMDYFKYATDGYNNSFSKLVDSIE